MVPLGVGVKGNVFFEHLNDIAAQSHTLVLGRYSKVRTTLLK